MSDKFNIIEYSCDQIDQIIAHIAKKRPENLWMFEYQKAYWDQARDAKKNGKTLVFFSGPIPLELVYSFDCYPFFLDTMSCRVAASDPALTAKYVDATEKYCPSSMCGIDKAQLGAVLCGDLGEKPDIFLYNSVPCDSSRIAHPALQEIYGVPSYCFDVPFHEDERSYEYLADQYEDFILFMEEHTGKKLDWDKLKKICEISNETYEYLIKIGELRKIKPCPLASRFLVLNELVAGMTGDPAALDYVKKQYEIGKANAEKGIGAVKEEKYRVSWLQNMVWSNTGIMDWMEKEFGAVVVMDAFGYQGGLLFNDLDDRRTTLKDFARKATHSPMIHGASGPVSRYIDLVDNIMSDYSVNVSMFMGHVGCKHTWASAKIVTDMVQEKYGIPTLYLDVDAIDSRYKSADEIKAAIREYMETIVMKDHDEKTEKSE